LLGSASLALGCAAHASAPLNARPPPQIDRSGNGVPGASAQDLICDAGDAAACERAGVERVDAGDFLTATRYFEPACAAGRPGACNQLGFLSATGMGVVKDEPKAFTFYERSCAVGDEGGCASVAFALAQGRGTAKDERRALALAQTWCDRGGALACDELGLMFSEGQGTARNRARAVEMYERACGTAPRDREGHHGCFHLAEAYRDGDGVPRDPSKALALLTAACQASVPPGACNALGWMYWEGRDVPRAAPLAVSLFRRACDLGDEYGCTNLAARYWRGEGVTKDEDEAAVLLGGACGRGFQKACDDLSAMGRPLGNAGTVDPCARCRGTVSPALEHEITRRAQEAHRCYDQALGRNRELHGRLNIELRVAQDGRVCASRTARDELGDTKLDECVHGYIDVAPLEGAIGGCVSVNVPLNFVVGSARRSEADAGP
jgi:TPR repeat protein